MDKVKKHGGPRVPGPGKRIGRKPTPISERVVQLNAWVKPDAADRIFSEAQRRDPPVAVGVIVTELAAKHLPQANRVYPPRLRAAVDPDDPPI